MESFNEFVSNILAKFPTSIDKSEWYDYEIMTTTQLRPNRKIGITRHKNTSMYNSFKVCDASKLEKTHVEQIKKLLEKHKNMQCFVRVITEHIKFTESELVTGYYTRIQFEPMEGANV